MVILGGGLWHVLWPRRLFYLWLEHHGWFSGNHLHCRPPHVADQRLQPQDLWYPASVSSVTFLASLEGHKSGARLEAGRTNPPIVTTTHRKYRLDLLHVFHYLWDFGSATV